MPLFETWEGKSDHLYAVCVQKSYPEIVYELDMGHPLVADIDDLYHVYIANDSYNSFHEADNWTVRKLDGTQVICEPVAERLYSTVELSNVAVLSKFDLPDFKKCPGCRSPIVEGVVDGNGTGYCSVSCMNEVMYQ